MNTQSPNYDVIHLFNKNNEIISAMTQALRNLESTPKQYQSTEYQEIYARIQQFIEQNCIHQIVYDSIDTCSDCSQTIKYCVKCEETFN